MGKKSKKERKATRKRNARSRHNRRLRRPDAVDDVPDFDAEEDAIEPRKPVPPWVPWVGTALIVSAGLGLAAWGVSLYQAPSETPPELEAAAEVATPADVASPTEVDARPWEADIEGMVADPVDDPGTPQPPGPVPEGKVWNSAHGHWHDL